MLTGMRGKSLHIVLSRLRKPYPSEVSSLEKSIWLWGGVLDKQNSKISDKTTVLYYSFFKQINCFPRLIFICLKNQKLQNENIMKN